MKTLVVLTCALAIGGCGPTSTNEKAAIAESSSGASAGATGVAAGAASASAAANASGAAAAAPSSPSISDADRAAVLKAAKLSANPQGQVKNECDEMVTPQLLAVDLGTKVGKAVLLAMEGGPKLASCYGDGPGLTLFRETGGSWKEIYSSRGASLAVMKDMHNGAPDLVFAGPGFSHPAYEWSGSDYLPTTRTVPDDRLEHATILP